MKALGGKKAVTRVFLREMLLRISLQMGLCSSLSQLICRAITPISCWFLPLSFSLKRKVFDYAWFRSLVSTSLLPGGRCGELLAWLARQDKPLVQMQAGGFAASVLCLGPFSWITFIVDGFPGRHLAVLVSAWPLA
ncbi:MAG TPA: hypothetical protein ENJ82_16810 [Bacteroidetes bacterium]|nr:hypothetical protein [Bacteroidota bacterium]